MGADTAFGGEVEGEEVFAFGRGTGGRRQSRENEWVKARTSVKNRKRRDMDANYLHYGTIFRLFGLRLLVLVLGRYLVMLSLPCICLDSNMYRMSPNAAQASQPAAIAMTIEAVKAEKSLTFGCLAVGAKGKGSG